MALLGREAGDDEDAWRCRYRPWRARGERVEVDPAAHDMKPVPQERVGHAAQLGAREVGDADDERSGRRLEVETGVRLVDEILKAVNRKAPGPLLTVAEVADLGGEPRNRGRRLTEVGVEVGDAVGPAVLHRERCVGEMHEASQGDRQIEARRAQGPDDQTEEGDRVVGRHAERGPEEPDRPCRLEVQGPAALGARHLRGQVVGSGRFMAIGTISAPRRRISSISLVMNVVATPRVVRHHVGDSCCGPPVGHGRAHSRSRWASTSASLVTIHRSGGSERQHAGGTERPDCERPHPRPTVDRSRTTASAAHLDERELLVGRREPVVGRGLLQGGRGHPTIVHPVPDEPAVDLVGAMRRSRPRRRSRRGSGRGHRHVERPERAGRVRAHGDHRSTATVRTCARRAVTTGSRSSRATRITPDNSE